jgi:hypothetical protein
VQFGKPPVHTLMVHMRIKERRNKRFTAALMLQSSALASDFATAYSSGSRLSVSLIFIILVHWCSGVNPAVEEEPF